MGLLSGGNIIGMACQAMDANLIVLLHHNYFAFGLINAASFALAAVVLIQDWRQCHIDDQNAAQTQAQTLHGNLRQGFKAALRL